MRRTLAPLSALATALAVAALAALAVGCGSGGPTTPTTTAAAACTRVKAPAPKPEGHLRKPTSSLSATIRWTATVQTNCGTFTILLDVAHAPKTTASFVSLARRGFYDDLTFHRIAPGFVIQGGDPLGRGMGGPGYTIVEPPPRDTRYTHGVVAMAKTATDPDGASGSQFFVVTADDAELPPQYAVLGRVTDGLDVIDRIDALPLQDSDPQGSPPRRPVVIQHVSVQHG